MKRSMKRWRLFLVAMTFLLLVPAGPLPAAAAEPLPLTEADNNRTVQVDLGGTLELTLASNKTTGFEWALVDEPDPGVVAIVYNGEYVPDNAPPQVVGSGGTQRWVLQAVGAGTTRLSLMYAKPWESVQPADTFAVEIVVNPAPAPSQPAQISFVVGSDTYTVGGQVYRMEDASPFIENDRVFVPVRYLVSAFGLSDADLHWDASSRAVTLPPAQDGSVYQLKIGDHDVYLKDAGGTFEAALIMDVTPEIVDGRAYVPARFIAGLFGYQASWDAAGKTLLLKAGQS
jgi:predicted secreted protein